MEATTNKGFSPARLLQALSQFPSVSRYWIAYSGGLDSHVLLHAMAALRAELSGVNLCAVHVDHGLQSSSVEWSRHCAAVCAALQIPYQSLAINAQPKSGESPEAVARDARYQAIAALIEEGECLLTAHHQDDQAETLLLQLLRGAGPRGLASMPAYSIFGKGLHARPLLGFSQTDLQIYAQARSLKWIDDQSNRNTDFDRNYLRHEIMPRLRTRWPAMARMLARSTGHAAEAAQLLDDLAQSDLETLQGLTKDADEEGCALTTARTSLAKNTLSVTRLRQLTKMRQRNVLRVWLEQLNLSSPNAVHIDHIISDVIMAAVDSMPCVRWPGAEVRRYRDLLYAMPPLPPHDASLCLTWNLQQTLMLPDGTRLTATPVQGSGIKEDLCRASTITVRFRQGGERCQPVGRDHNHELKKLFQEHGTPPWQRDRIPLIYINEQLVAVADLWICQPFQAIANEPGVIFETAWQ